MEKKIYVYAERLRILIYSGIREVYNVKNSRKKFKRIKFLHGLENPVSSIPLRNARRILLLGGETGRETEKAMAKDFADRSR